MKPIKLTKEQHIKLKRDLIKLARDAFPEEKGIQNHEAGTEYTLLMISFHLQIQRSCSLLLELYKTNPKWFPVIEANIILRAVFELNIIAHYISKEPKKRADEYLNYDFIIDKKAVDAFYKHKNIKREPMHTFIKDTINYEIKPKESEINRAYNRIISRYKITTKKGRIIDFKNWANKTIKDMAKEVNHEVEYDLFYSQLSNYTHANVKLFNKIYNLKNGDILLT